MMCDQCITAVAFARNDLKLALETRYGITRKDMADYLHDPEGTLPRLQKKAHERK